MDPIVEFAEMLKNFENKHYMGTVVATIESRTPLTIRIGDIQISGENVILAERMRNVEVNAEVIVSVSADNQQYFVLDKVVRHVT